MVGDVEDFGGGARARRWRRGVTRFAFSVLVTVLAVAQTQQAQAQDEAGGCDNPPCSNTGGGFPSDAFSPNEPEGYPGGSTNQSPANDPSYYNNVSQSCTNQSCPPPYSDPRAYDYSALAPVYSPSGLNKFNLASGAANGSEMRAIASTMPLVSAAPALRAAMSSASGANGSDPVQDGALVLERTDVTLPGQGIDFTFTRTYRNGIPHYGVLGQGWDFNYNRRIVGANSCGDVQLTMGNLGRVTFSVDTSFDPYTTYKPAASIPLRLIQVRDPDPTKTIWKLTDGTPLTYIFDYQGLLQSIYDPAGNTIVFQWAKFDGYFYLDDGVANIPPDSDLDFHITKIVDTTGREVYFQYQSPPSKTESGPNGQTIARDGGLFLQCVSLSPTDCSSALVSFNVDNSVELTNGTWNRSPTYGELLSATDAAGVLETYSYYHTDNTSTYLTDSAADAFCASACGDPNNCKNTALCARPESACLDFMNGIATNPAYSTLLDAPTACVDSILSNAGCAAQPLNYRYPEVWNPYCPNLAFVDHSCDSQCIQQVNANVQWQDPFWVGDQAYSPRNESFVDYSWYGTPTRVDTLPVGDLTTAVTGFCNEWCYATSLCQGQNSDLCLGIQKALIPFCTSDCYNDCRSRYQARDSDGNPITVWGRPEDLNHNLTEVRDGKGRLVQSIAYGTDPRKPDFNKVVTQTLGDGLLDPQASQALKFYYGEYPSLANTLPPPLKPVKVPSSGSSKPVAVNPSAIAASQQATPLKPPGSGTGSDPLFDGPGDFDSIDICPAACAKKQSPILRPPPGPPMLLPPLFAGALATPQSLTFNWVAGRKLAQIRLPATSVRELFGADEYQFANGNDHITIRSTALETFALEGSDHTLSELFGAAHAVMLRRDSDESAALVTFGAHPSVWRAQPSRTKRHPALPSAISLLLRRTGAHTAEASMLAAPPRSDIPLHTDSTTIHLLATYAPGVFEVRGAADSLPSSSAEMKALASGQLWQPPNLFMYYGTAAIRMLAPIVAFYMSGVQLGPHDECVEWKYAPAQVYQGINAVQQPATVTIIQDLRGVLRSEYYDAKGRLIRDVNHHNLDGEPTEITNYNYDDASGALSAIQYSDGRRLCLQSNSLGNTLQSTRLPASNAPGDAAPETKLFSYSDDRFLTEVTSDPDSTTPLTIEYERDRVQRVVSDKTKVDASRFITTKYEYDFPPTVLPRSITKPDSSVVFLDDYTPTGPQTITVGGNTSDPIVTKLGYDTYGLLTSRVRANHTGGQVRKADLTGRVLYTEIQGTDGNWHASVYAYDNVTRFPTKITTPEKTVFLSHDSLGHVRWSAETAYGVTGRATCFDYGVDGRLEGVVKPEGNFVLYHYDDANRLVRVEAGYPETLPQWASTCAQELSGLGLPMPKLESHPADLQTIQTIQYGLSGFPTKIGDGSGIAKTYVLDGLARVIDSIDGNGNHDRRGYDNRNRVVWRARYGANPPSYGKPTQLAAGVPLDSAVEFSYDNLDRVVEIDEWRFAGAQFVDPTHPKIIFTTIYDDATDTRTETVGSHAGGVTELDSAGRIISQKRSTGFVLTATYAETTTGDKATWTYVGEDGQTHNRTVFYDDFGQILKSKDSPNDDLSNILVRNEYDTFERLTDHFVGAQATHYDYDNFDRQTTLREGGEANPRTVTTDFDANDRMSSVRDGNGNKTIYGYNGLDLVESTTDPTGATGSWKYVAGATRLQTRTDVHGTSFSFYYEPNGWLQHQHVSNPALAYGEGMDRWFTHTPSGLVAAALLTGNAKNPTNNTLVTLQYDSLGNRILEDSSSAPIVIARTWNDLGGATQLNLYQRTLPTNALTISRTFDDDGRLAQLYSNGSLIAHLNQEAGAGRIDFGSAGLSAQPSYDSRGRTAGLELSLRGTVLFGVHEALGLDGAVRERQITSLGTAPLTSFYELDGGGRVIGENFQMSGISTIPQPPPDLDDSSVAPYINSPAQQGTTFRTYSLDGAGNWLSRTEYQGTTSSTIDVPLNQYSGFGGTAWGYDAASNVANVGADTYVYDAWGNLASATSNGTTTDFGYDAFGRRVLEHNLSTNSYSSDVWDGSDLIAWGPQGDASTLVVRTGGDGGDEHYALVRFGGSLVSYLHQDAVGSVVAASNDSGVVETYAYTAFGETAIYQPDGVVMGFSQIGNRFFFQGQLYDVELKAYSMRSREYRPDYGRFLSPDPIGLGGGENLYAFAWNKPLMFRDPFGRDPLSSFQNFQRWKDEEGRLWNWARIEGNDDDSMSTLLKFYEGTYSDSPRLLPNAFDVMNYYKVHASAYDANSGWTAAKHGAIAVVQGLAYPLFGDTSQETVKRILTAYVFSEAYAGLNRSALSTTPTIPAREPIPTSPATGAEASQPVRGLLAPPSTINPWGQGPIVSTVTTEPMTAYRVFGGGSKLDGVWLSPDIPASGSAARSSLALWPGNTAEFVAPVQIPVGTRIQIGPAAPAFGQLGGGTQIVLLDDIPLSSYGTPQPLAP